jgi:hypothetical protein
VKVQLVKGDKKVTYGKEPFEFDYFHKPLTVEEKFRVRSNIVWKKGNSKRLEPDFSKFNAFELLDIAITHIEKLYDSDDKKISNIEELKTSSFDSGVIDGVIESMWISVFIDMSLSEEIKKKLLQDSTLGETK